MADNVKSNYVDVNGIRLHYIEKGRGELLVFLHGFPEFSGAWDQQIEEFGRDYHAVAPDMRGYNLSSKPDDLSAYRATELIEDLHQFADKLGHSKFTLVAHDWGGAVAWSFAMRHPERLQALIIINAPHAAIFARELLHNPAQQEASSYMNMFRSPEAETILSDNNYAYLTDNLFRSWGGKWIVSDEVRQKYISAWSQPKALTGGLNYYRVSPLFPPQSDEDKKRIQGIVDLPDKMFTVEVPTLVIWGELDKALLTGNLNGLETYVKNLEVKRIPDATHWVVHEKPQVVNTLIRDFLNRL